MRPATLAAMALALLLAAAPGRAAPPDSSDAADSLALEAVALDSLAGSPAAAPPATRDYLAEVRANFTPENRSYQRTRTALAFLEPLYALLAGVIVLFSGLAARLRDIAYGLSRRRYLRVLVYLALYSVVGFALAYPLEWFRGFALERQYGLSTRSWSGWFGDELKSLAFSIVVLGVVPIVALVYRVFERSPRRGWLWLSAGTLPVLLAAVLLQPLVFDPVFNTFRPLRDPMLRERILALAERAGIPARHVYEVDKSRQTTKYNAYVSGFGASQRIVLWDTTLRGMREDEILFVMSHEMGHYRLGHIWKSIALESAGSVLFFLAAFGLMRWAIRRIGPRCGITALHDLASMPLLAVIVSLLSFAAQPAVNQLSRGIEHESDGFGLEVTRDNDAAARAFLKLGSQNRSDPEPGPIERWFLYSHPPLAERVRFALEYRPWERGEPNRWYHGPPAR